jgi:quinone-modifying oxidoreductase, subunit QmoC
MSNKVDPNLIRELEHFGLKDANKCYNCGTCTAVCNLSTPENPFPRKIVRYIQLGQRDKIETSPEPWLCYFCGDCSTRCPRGADPGETMMVMRRYLTSLYDWTGFARKFYTSERFEIIAISVVAAIVGLGMIIWGLQAPNPNWDYPAINSIWPAHDVEIADLGMAAILSFLLLSNVYRCIRVVLGEYWGKIPLRIYKDELKLLLTHFLTQKEFGKCNDRHQWIVHLAIMTGYASVFLMVVLFIAGPLPMLIQSEWWQFQRDYTPEMKQWYSLLHPLRLIGYYATFAIMYGTTYAIIGRLKKSKPQYKNSHGTDWMFLILLQLTTMTGIFIHFSGLLGLVFITYALYVIHMMVAIPMLVLEVPFAKWAHLAYRPVVLFLLRAKARYTAEYEVAKEPELIAKPAV